MQARQEIPDSAGKKALFDPFKGRILEQSAGICITVGRKLTLNTATTTNV
jgi:hypothetical protein